MAVVKKPTTKPVVCSFTIHEILWQRSSTSAHCAVRSFLPRKAKRITGKRFIPHIYGYPQRLLRYMPCNVCTSLWGRTQIQTWNDGANQNVSTSAHCAVRCFLPRKAKRITGKRFIPHIYGYPQRLLHYTPCSVCTSLWRRIQIQTWLAGVNQNVSYGMTMANHAASWVR